MLGRHYLEESLQKAIEDGQVEDARSLIELIQKHTIRPSLSSRSEMQRTFLCTALVCGVPEIATLLLKIQQNDTALMTAVDKDNRSILWHAIDRSLFDFATNLMTISESAKCKLWLLADIHGTTPLHLSARKDRMKIATAILERIFLEKDALEIINQTDTNGDTPLHSAFHLQSFNIIAMLINAGADVRIHNDKQQTPLSYLLRFNLQEQIKLFNQLNQNRKKYILQLYKSELVRYPENIGLRHIYFQLAGLMSLKELASAHLDFNLETPIHNTYRDAKGIEVHIPDLIYELIPMYKSRLLHAAKEIGIVAVELKSQNESILAKDWIQVTSIQEEENKSIYRLLDEDRVNINSLLNDVNRYMAELQQRPHHGFTNHEITNKSLAVLVPLACLLATIGIMIGLYYGGEASSYDHKHWGHSHRVWHPAYLVFYVLFALGAFLGIAASGALSKWYFCDKEINITPQEWRNIVNGLNRNITEKLHALHENNLPTSMQNVRDLDSIVTELECKHSITETISIFQRLQTLLQTLKSHMNTTHRPVSLFSTRDTVIDIRDITKETLVNERSRLIPA